LPGAKWIAECYFFKHSAKSFFAVAEYFFTLGKEASLPSIFFTLGKENFKAHFKTVN
jgi:hypothetical protein